MYKKVTTQMSINRLISTVVDEVYYDAIPVSGCVTDPQKLERLAEYEASRTFNETCEQDMIQNGGTKMNCKCNDPKLCSCDSTDGKKCTHLIGKKIVGKYVCGERGIRISYLSRIQTYYYVI